MADIRINALATTAASTASDDYIAIDGSANGTRKLDAYSPTFGGNLTVSGTGTSSFAGKLGIGTTSPSDKLHVQGAAFITDGINAGVRIGGAASYGWLSAYDQNVSAAKPLVLQTGGGNVLVGGTIDGGQKLQVSGTAYVSGDATFAAGVTINGKANFSWSGANGPVLNRTDGSGYFILNKSNGVNGVTLSATSGGELSFYTGDGLTLAATLTSSSASFVGAISIGNTVQTAVAVASTHKVTISIGGSTYYLLATNV